MLGIECQHMPEDRSGATLPIVQHGRNVRPRQWQDSHKSLSCQGGLRGISKRCPSRSKSPLPPFAKGRCWRSLPTFMGDWDLPTFGKGGKARARESCEDFCRTVTVLTILTVLMVFSGCAATPRPLAHYQSGIDYHAKGQWGEAIREYQRAINLDPADPDPRFNLGVLYQDRGNLKEAKEQYQAILDRHRDYAPAWMNLASLQELEGDMQAAEASYARAQQADPISSAPASQMGFFLLRRQRPDDAAAAFNEALRRDPHSANGHYGLGSIAEARGDYQLALKHFVQAVQSNPRDLQAYLKVGELSGRLGLRDDAIRYLRRAALLDPVRGETYFELGLLLRDAQRWKAAEQAFREALAQGARPAECHQELSRIYERLAVEERRSIKAD
jgi:tetratricopeptide (TPR) repeat protein